MSPLFSFTMIPPPALRSADSPKLIWGKSEIAGRRHLPPPSNSLHFASPHRTFPPPPPRFYDIWRLQTRLPFLPLYFAAVRPQVSTAVPLTFLGSCGEFNLPLPPSPIPPPFPSPGDLPSRLPPLPTDSGGREALKTTAGYVVQPCLPFLKTRHCPCAVVGDSSASTNKAATPGSHK
ncbi:uncharacterized protein LOC131015303 [Salvia miltiorrhiza]|uniref:uncharacterized protein LOC131015302 n=1 Tax=Salvia miltiorrhiza TaxID=226208 RepID=UPI0025ABE296|nr:uncharacterized protein LOC131015302 [Salvia miltiorrhiza]XP_057799640.1 uncharacterized protein LOC131015303 [Salvia miltiorrhiza]